MRNYDYVEHNFDDIDEAEKVYSGYDGENYSDDYETIGTANEKEEKNHKQKKSSSVCTNKVMRKIFKNYGLDPDDDTIGMKLDPETEKQLFIDAKSKDKKKSEQAKNWIVRQYLKFVISVVRAKYPSYWEEHHLNLIQAGLQGILYAAINGKINLECKTGSITTQLSNWIKNRTSEYVTSEVHQKKIYYVYEEKKINAAKTKLFKMGNTNPSIVDIAVESGLRTSQVEKIVKGAHASNYISIEGENLDPVDNSYHSNPELVIDGREEKDALHEAINSSLSGDERTVIILKHGLFGLEARTNTFIQGIIGGTTADVSAYEHSAMLKLRLNPALRAYYNANDSIGSDLAYEPIAITPNRSAKMMMEDILAADNDIDF